MLENCGHGMPGTGQPPPWSLTPSNAVVAFASDVTLCALCPLGFVASTWHQVCQWTNGTWMDGGVNGMEWVNAMGD